VRLVDVVGQQPDRPACARVDKPDHARVRVILVVQLKSDQLAVTGDVDAHEAGEISAPPKLGPRGDVVRREWLHAVQNAAVRAESDALNPVR
jgi:hypothetical protein